MRHAGPSTASPCTSNHHPVALFPTGDPQGALASRESRRMLTLSAAPIEPLVTTAVATPTREGRPARGALPSWRTVLSLVAGVVSLLALVASHPDAQASFQPSSIDRGMVVESLQTLSDYVGFEGHFAVGSDDRTLVMTGSDLCGDDFPQVVPPALWHRVVESGFRVFECSAAGTHVRLEVRP
jgi:hypothetical protein